MIMILMGLIIATIIIGMIFVTTPHPVHKSIVINNCDFWDYGTFDEFVREYEKYEWETYGGYENSLFVKDYYSNKAKTRIHANIINFEGKGMVMNNIINYYRMKLFVRREYRKRAEYIDKRQKGLWGDNNG